MSTISFYQKQSVSLISQLYREVNLNKLTLQRLSTLELATKISSLEQLRIDFQSMNLQIKSQVEMLIKEAQAIRDIEQNGDWNTLPTSKWSKLVTTKTLVEEVKVAIQLLERIEDGVQKWQPTYSQYQSAYLSKLANAFASSKSAEESVRKTILKILKRELVSLNCNSNLSVEQQKLAAQLLKDVKKDFEQIEKINLIKLKWQNTELVNGGASVNSAALTQQVQSPLLHLPNEILNELFQDFNVTDLNSLALVCTEMNAVTSDDHFWKKHLNFKKEFPTLTQCPEIALKHHYAAAKAAEAYQSALCKIWPRIAQEITEPLENPPQTAKEINTFLDNPANAAILKAITRLNLCNLDLTVLPPKIFRHLINLKHLNLSFNRLKSLPDLNTLTQLEELDLGHNQLKELPDMSAWIHLKTLIARGNQLKWLPNLSSLTQLEELDLGSNQLKRLPDLSKLSRLRGLWLQRNQLKQLPKLSVLSQLKTLYLGRNSLAQIPDLSALAQLEYVNFMNNPCIEVPKIAEQVSHELGLHFSGDLIMFMPKHVLESQSSHPAVQQFQDQLKYPSQSQLARYYQTLMKQESSEQEIQNLFKKLKVADQHLIYEMVWLLSGKPKGDDQWGEHHVFDNMQIFYRAVQKAILTKLERLSPEKKNAVYRQLARHSQTKNPRSEEHHALKNIPLLADALDRINPFTVKGLDSLRE